MTLIFLFCVYSVSRTRRFAESEGFEPPVRRNAYTAFRVRHFRPLSQLSGCALPQDSGNATPFSQMPFRTKERAKVLLFFDIRKCFAFFFQKKVNYRPIYYSMYNLFLIDLLLNLPQTIGA